MYSDYDYRGRGVTPPLSGSAGAPGRYSDYPPRSGGSEQSRYEVLPLSLLPGSRYLTVNQQRLDAALKALSGMAALATALDSTVTLVAILPQVAARTALPLLATLAMATLPPLLSRRRPGAVGSAEAASVSTRADRSTLATQGAHELEPNEPNIANKFVLDLLFATFFKLSALCS